MRTTSYGASVSSSSPSALAASELGPERNRVGRRLRGRCLVQSAQRQRPVERPDHEFPLGRREVCDEHPALTVGRAHREPDGGELIARRAVEYLGPMPLCSVGERVVQREDLARHRAEPLRQLRAAGRARPLRASRSSRSRSPTRRSTPRCTSGFLSSRRHRTATTAGRRPSRAARRAASAVGRRRHGS